MHETLVINSTPVYVMVIHLPKVLACASVKGLSCCNCNPRVRGMSQVLLATLEREWLLMRRNRCFRDLL